MGSSALPTPPSYVTRPDPNKILEQPVDTDEKIVPDVRDFSFHDIDPGIFNTELINEKLYVKGDINGEKTPEYQGGNVTLGSYSGTQAAITQIYDRIERA